MTSEFCMEALISGVLLSSSVNLIYADSGLGTINKHPYMIDSYTSRKHLCLEKERVALKDNNFKLKINTIE